MNDKSDDSTTIRVLTRLVHFLYGSKWRENDLSSYPHLLKNPHRREEQGRRTEVPIQRFERNYHAAVQSVLYIPRGIRQPLRFSDHAAQEQK